MPAEWAPHRACWTALPHLEEEWLDALSGAREELLQLVERIATQGAERVELLVPDAAAAEAIRQRLPSPRIRLHPMRYGDSWLRDTGPIFLNDGSALAFRFDGWGGKFQMPGDTEVAARIAERAEAPLRSIDFVLEGGAIEVDGEGSCMTTRDCLLARHPERSEAEIEAVLAEALGVDRVIWLDGALRNDHTDGHIDTLARFVAPGHVVCMEPSPGEPNAEMLEGLAAALERTEDAQGRRLKVSRLPSAGAILDPEGALMPASYCNFYIANEAVIVPLYGCAHDETALRALRPLFPGRRVVGSPSRALLRGGGAFHCVTQQEPQGARLEEENR
ncbi:MAG: agmatine deiminase family protein [Myxococcales bacterium]|nr:agmatine deiminase family protein [Myxococcales bacterium]